MDFGKELVRILIDIIKNVSDEDKKRIADAILDVCEDKYPTGWVAWSLKKLRELAKIPEYGT